MKILIIQIARFGDIFQSWPAIKALKRAQPEAEIHLLVRKRFSEAAEGLTSVDKLHTLDTEDILKPVVCEHPELDQSVAKISAFLDSLAAEEYDRVINLSFSTLSSYITDFVSGPNAKVAGYTRFSDGHLAIPDDTSAYFYAQVGETRWNRVHLTDIFAAVAEVDLQPDEIKIESNHPIFNTATSWRDRHGLEHNNYAVIHVGDRQWHRNYSAFKWRRVLARLSKEYSGKIVLAGSRQERNLADEIAAGFSPDQILNLVGETRLADLFALMQSAQLLIAGDSLLIQVAALTGTPCLNISFGTANFWEKGPKSVGSRILWSASPENLPSDRVSREAVALLNGENLDFGPVIKVTEQTPVCMELVGFEADDFPWSLIQSLYMGKPFFSDVDSLTPLGFSRLFEVSSLALEQIDLLGHAKNGKTAVAILQQVDEIIIQIEKMVPRIQPVIAWFQTERLRIGPAGIDAILMKTKELFTKLNKIAALYCTSLEAQSDLGGPDGLKDANIKV